ncbi:Cof-type HAD-IIB family hydrolase [Shimazuella sp. AN120528]|uniref:Cof-type HAD-IIB family hydrolase n=1 Tax=Shimazuella soli TaxID=1892854 RepID=UPI001F0CEFAF|nr:Cof-type HAD-IIB family hydrolase [Shimazuella soli]MCH5583482.1 Cof-type HAD-IIB family hydrolase [Shimazuella soli]
MIRLVVTDLDDTLLNKYKLIDLDNLNALLKLRQAGIQVAYASGRNEYEVDLVVNTVPGVFHRICQNGAYVSVNGKDRIFEEHFAPDLAKQIFRIGQASKMHCFIGTAQEMFTTEAEDSFRYPEHMIPKGLVRDIAVEQRMGVDVHPSKFCFLGEKKHLLELQKEMLREFRGKVDTFISGSTYLDVMPTGIHKGNGIRHLAKHLGIDPRSEVACMGDSENDVPMFEEVFLSFVMGGAKPHVREAAKHEVSSFSEAVDRVLAHNASLAS